MREFSPSSIILASVAILVLIAAMGPWALGIATLLATIAGLVAWGSPGRKT